jgi:purine catabolism regulator
MAKDAFLLRDLVRSPALEVRVVAGEQGLDRPVRWAHVSELEDPTPWLLGEELIMTTGIAVPAGQRQQGAYLERLARAGVSGLAVTEQLHMPPLHQATIRRANRLAFPILAVPLSVPFIAIAQEVAAAAQSSTYRQLTAQLHVFGALRALADEDLSVSELFTRLESLSGYRLYVGSSAGRPLLPDVPAPPDELAPLLPAAASAAPVIPGGYVLPIPAPGRSSGILVALEEEEVVATGLAVVQHIATIAGLQLTTLRHEREAARRRGAEVLAELLQGTGKEPSSRWELARAGLAPEAGLAVVVGRCHDVGALIESIEVLGEPVLTLRQGDDVVFLMPSELSLERAASPGTAFGVSAPFVDVSSVPVRRREAAWAAARAAELGQTVLRFGSGQGIERWLADDPNALRALAHSLLGPVLDYDSAHGTELVHTTRTWMLHDRRNAPAAKSLHIHANTLAYRLSRFEELTGRSLASTAALTEIWLAMTALVDHETAPTGSATGDGALP